MTDAVAPSPVSGTNPASQTQRTPTPLQNPRPMPRPAAKPAWLPVVLIGACFVLSGLLILLGTMLVRGSR